MGLPRQGIFLTSPEIEDYLALWRYVAYLIGVPDTITITLPSSSGGHGQQKIIIPFGGAQEAKVVMESIVLFGTQPSQRDVRRAGQQHHRLLGEPATPAQLRVVLAGAGVLVERLQSVQSLAYPEAGSVVYHVGYQSVFVFHGVLLFKAGALSFVEMGPVMGWWTPE
nr:hypothetical protein B5O22.210 [imported] - Neurospora crassa [Neurospora crassa]